MSNKSILTKEEFEALLTQIRQNMVDKNLGPVLLMHTVDGQRLACNLTKLPGTPEEKRQHLLAAGASLRQDGVMVKEAILICEAWFVKADKSSAVDTLPSEHPERQEAVVLVGRNAESTHSTCAIQPFTRNENGKPVWQEVTLHTDNEAGSGLLDWFFAGQELEAIPMQI
jgi:hypothetical protein